MGDVSNSAFSSIQVRNEIVNAKSRIGYHGSKKPRKRSRNYWTYRKRRGGFAWQLWKKWFNNRAMNNLERRLRGESCRKGGERYGLRKLEPKRVETKHMRMESLGHI